MTDQEINQIIRNIVRTELGMPEHTVIPANTNTPTGKQMFSTVLISEVLDKGWDDVVQVDGANNTVNETAHGLRKLLVSIQFFRTGAVIAASKFRTRLQLSPAMEKFAANGLGFVKSSGVRVLSQVIKTMWEERAQLNIEIYIVGKAEAILDTYGEFPFNIDTETVSVSGVVHEP